MCLKAPASVPLIGPFPSCRNETWGVLGWCYKRPPTLYWQSGSEGPLARSLALDHCSCLPPRILPLPFCVGRSIGEYVNRPLDARSLDTRSRRQQGMRAFWRCMLCKMRAGQGCDRLCTSKWNFYLCSTEVHTTAKPTILCIKLFLTRTENPSGLIKKECYMQSLAPGSRIPARRRPLSRVHAVG